MQSLRKGMRLSESVFSARVVFCCILVLLGTAGCGLLQVEETDGPTFVEPSFTQPAFHSDIADEIGDAVVDVSAVSQGYVAASAKGEDRLKFEVRKGGASSHYDLPNDGSPIYVPITMGNGEYVFRILQNTQDNYYFVLSEEQIPVNLESEFAPFLLPSTYCDFDSDSMCVKKARELSVGAQNQGDVLRNIYRWVIENVDYDARKASWLGDAKGYVPNPEETFVTGQGVCFDYASLTAAMLRSQGIPCKIVTGTVAPDNVYHAWNMVYLDGEWKSPGVSVLPNEWTLLDLTFADGGDHPITVEGKTYNENGVY